MRNHTLWNDSSILSPWRGLFNIERNLDRMFDDTFGKGRSDLWEDQSVSHPACEVEENDSHYVMSFDMPGVSKKNIEIEVSGNRLLVTGERKNEQNTSAYSERTYGKFQRILTLPQGVDADRIEAHYQDGVLSLAVPKAESAKTRQIKITEGKSTFFEKLLGGTKEVEKEQKAVTAANAA